jgi:hypothetical protein
VIISLALAASCAGAPQPPPTNSPAHAGDSLAMPAPGEWATWSHARKKLYMEQVVVVDAKKMFAQYDPVRFSDVTCKTCHGAGVDDGSYRMPNPALTALVPTKIVDLAAAHPQTFIFMDGWVVPHMAKLLGKPTFDHLTMSGFGCFACHTAAK